MGCLEPYTPRNVNLNKYIKNYNYFKLPIFRTLISQVSKINIFRLIKFVLYQNKFINLKMSMY